MKVVTWNMQGGSHGTNMQKVGLLNKFFSEGYDVICLQEATEPLGSFDVDGPVAALGGVKVYTQESPYSPRLQAAPHGANKYTCYYYEWGTGNSRCSLATYVKTAICSNHGVIFPSSLVRQRPMLWVQILISGVYFRIGNVHLISRNPADAFAQFCQFRDAMIGLGEYAIVGDFNMKPDYLAPLTTPNAPASTLSIAHFHHPGVATQTAGGILDYCYYEGVRRPCVEYDSRFTYSDHRFLIYNIHL